MFWQGPKYATGADFGSTLADIKNKYKNWDNVKGLGRARKKGDDNGYAR